MAFDPHDTEAHMPYEVVDPADRDERGTIHRTLTEAMVASSPTFEVWELAEDEPQTRMVMCWPDEEFQPAAGIDTKGTKQFVREQVGRAEREATAMLAEYSPVTGEKVHALVSLAWGRGYIAGFRDGGRTFTDLIEREFGGGRT